MSKKKKKRTAANAANYRARSSTPRPGTPARAGRAGPLRGPASPAAGASRTDAATGPQEEPFDDEEILDTEDSDVDELDTDVDLEDDEGESAAPHPRRWGRRAAPTPTLASTTKRASSRPPARSTGRPRPPASRTPTARRAPSGQGRPARRPQAPVAEGPAITQPPVGIALARGIAVVGRSPALLTTSFVGALILWLIYSSSGVIHFASVAVMAQIEAIPPIHSLLDLAFVRELALVTSGATIALLGLAIVFVRGMLGVLWLGLIFDAYDHEGRDGLVASLRSAARRGIPLLGRMLGIEVAFVVLASVASSVLGVFLGGAGLLASLVAIAYFLIYAPIILVREGVGLRDAAALSVRVSKVRGSGRLISPHMGLIVAYVFFSIVLISSTGRSPAAPVTPSIVEWAYILFLNFIHVGILAAFAYRWELLRDPVLTMESQPRKPVARKSAPGTGLLRRRL
jgi:hypothetical protein